MPERRPKTEAQRATKRVRELEEQLEQAERLAKVGLTTAGLAHAVKNILAGLEGGVYVVDAGLQQNDLERVRGGWEMVKAYLEKTAALVNNLLQYAKPQQPVRETVGAGALVDGVLELYASKAELMNVALHGEKEEQLPSLLGERDALAGCLANLVSNALDACAWDPDAQKSHRVLVRASRLPQGGVCLEVGDNGMGISTANQPKVLSCSFTTKGIRGTGLGLLLTKTAVESHGGRISFSSTPGAGTTFRIELPATE